MAGMDSSHVQGMDGYLVNLRWMSLARGRCWFNVAMVASRGSAALVSSIAGLTVNGVVARPFAPGYG